MMPTIKDVAKLANVSIGTVSRYLNGYNVKEENKKKIELAIKELDFKFNPMAKGLRTNKTFSVGVLIPSITDIFCTQVIEGMQETFDKYNYSIIICDTRNKLENEIEKVKFLMAKRVDGIIIMPVSNNGEHIKLIQNSGMPVVLIDRLIENLSCDTIVCDNVNDAYEAVENIIRRGHRKIGIIAGPQNIYTAKERLEGYRRALNDYNIEINESFIVYSEYKKGAGYEAYEKLLNLKDRPTAIFATNYETTLTGIIFFKNMGISIGEDISFFGYDQTELFQMLTPPLSVVVQPMNEIGKDAAELLVKRMNGDMSFFPLIKRLKTSIVVADSIKNLIDTKIE